MIVNTDIDIDVADRNKLLTLIKHTPATINEKNKIRKHNTGVYFHKIPENPFNGLSTVDYKEAEELGYFKLDILNVSIYKNIESKEQLDELLDMEPMWELLEHKEVVEQLFHIHNHFEIVKKLKPQNIEQLAAVLAVIRPAKRYLLDKDWDTILHEVWIKPKGDDYYFKKAHAFAYAHAIVLQLNMLTKGFSLQD
jgi:hypothetical protein